MVKIKKIVEIENERGVKVMVDGSKGEVKMKVDVKDMGCEWYVFKGKKVYGN